MKVYLSILLLFFTSSVLAVCEYSNLILEDIKMSNLSISYEGNYKFKKCEYKGYNSISIVTEITSSKYCSFVSYPLKEVEKGLYQIKLDNGYISLAEPKEGSCPDYDNYLSFQNVNQMSRLSLIYSAVVKMLGALNGNEKDVKKLLLDHHTNKVCELCKKFITDVITKKTIEVNMINETPYPPENQFYIVFNGLEFQWSIQFHLDKRNELVIDLISRVYF